MSEFLEILNELEKVLALERALGVTTVECDRDVLNVELPSIPPPTVQAIVAEGPAAVQTMPAAVPTIRASAPKTAPMPAPARSYAQNDAQGDKAKTDARRVIALDYVYLHHAPLSAAGHDLLAKARAALRRTEQETPLVYEGELPQARYYVVLGKLALQKWFPGYHPVMDRFFTLRDGRRALYLYSPDEIFRYNSASKAVKDMKVTLWGGMKKVEERSRE